MRNALTLTAALLVACAFSAPAVFADDKAVTEKPVKAKKFAKKKMVASKVDATQSSEKANAEGFVPYAAEDSLIITP